MAFLNLNLNLNPNLRLAKVLIGPVNGFLVTAAGG